MDTGDRRVHFREPPSFQVRRWTLNAVYKLGPKAQICGFIKKLAPGDQVVTEGQDVVISAKVSGQPAPTARW